MQGTVSWEARVSDEMTGDEGCGYIPCLDERPARDIDCRDPAELTANLPEWHWDLTRLEGGEFHARATTIPLEAVFIAKLKFNRALLHRIRPPLGCVSILMFDQSVGAVFVECHGTPEVSPLDILDKFRKAGFRVATDLDASGLLLAWRDRNDDPGGAPS